MPTELMMEPVRSVSLYDLELSLCAFAAMIEEIDDPERRQEMLEELGAALRYARDKRDRVVAFLRHCAAQEAFADEEIERLKKRRERIARVRSELEGHVVQLIAQLAEPDRRGVQRLDGNHSGMRIQRNPESVFISDVDALPETLKDAVITLPAFLWRALLDRVSVEDRGAYEAFVKRSDLKPDKRAIATQLKSGAEVCGACLKPGEFRLVLS